MEKRITLTKTFQWLFLLFVLLSAFIGSAQITITHDDMPVAGTVIMRAMDTATITDPGSSGMNQTWDYSMAVAHLSDTVDYLLPSQVPGGNLFPGANLAEGRTIFDPAGNFSNYIFWNSSETGMYAIGWNLSFGSPGYSFISVQQYEPDPNTLPLPLTYGNTSTVSTTGERYSSTRIENVLLDSSRVVSHITLNMTADGSGTLITPVGTYEVLRIVEASTHIDSTFSWNPGSGWVFESTETFNLTNYRWFANNFGEVATLSIDQESIQFQYLSAIIINVPDVGFTSKINIYPNPAGDILYIDGNNPVTKVEIYSVSGQLILTSNNKNAVDISSLDSGVYVSKVYMNGMQSTSKFIKK
ncbi:MAG TPA: T9SS type A sorting domain-containing protein [Lentimicrobium sp.]|nr:T9SS type A sorting domain-containing protein [Lentimicrobium sp.]